MSTIKAGSLDRGTFLLYKGAPYLVSEREFVNPGKGSAFVRVRLKHVKTGAVLKETFKTQDQLEVADVEDRPCQYLYDEGTQMHWMDNSSYEQFVLDWDVIDDKRYFLKLGESYPVVFWSSQAIDVKVPPKVVFEIVEAEEAVRGDTVGNVLKRAKTETGLEIRIPLFIKVGERVLFNTETREYVERVNK